MVFFFKKRKQKLSVVSSNLVVPKLWAVAPGAPWQCHGDAMGCPQLKNRLFFWHLRLCEISHDSCKIVHYPIWWSLGNLWRWGYHFSSKFGIHCPNGWRIGSIMNSSLLWGATNPYRPIIGLLFSPFSPWHLLIRGELQIITLTCALEMYPTEWGYCCMVTLW